MDLAHAIARVSGGGDLTSDEMFETIGEFVGGRASPAQIAALLIALKMKGETVPELVGAARAIRARALPLAVPEGAVVDTCGTGGDGRGTLNVSTLAALVVAAAGVRVAKHGNRALSSRAGSANLLEALGVEIAAPRPVVEQCLAEVGVGFLFAPAFHGATKQVAAVRKELGVRTIFNLLGPLTNPAGVRHQVIGVYHPRLLEPFAAALGELGSERVLVIHGAGGLDEFAPDGPTEVAELKEGSILRYTLTPRDFELGDEDPKGLEGGDAATNAELALALLRGELRGAARSVVVMTAAAALLVAEGGSFVECARRAGAALDRGAALKVLDRLRTTSRAPIAVSTESAQ